MARSCGICRATLLRFKILMSVKRSLTFSFAIAGQRIRHREVNFRAKFRKYAFVKIIFIDVDFSLPIKVSVFFLPMTKIANGKQLQRQFDFLCAPPV